MPASDDLRDGMAEAFDALSEEFQSAVDVALVRPAVDPSDDTFETILTITSKRFWEYSNFRQNFLLEIADDNDALTSAISNATHVRINDDFYSINVADTLPPSGTNPVWRLYCDLFERSGKYAAYAV